MLCSRRGIHQTSPIVKLIDPEHFTNSHPYEAILGAMDASWGVLSRLNFRRWLKKFLGKKKMTPEVEFWGTPHFFLRNFTFRPSLNCSRQRQPKRPQNPPGLASIAAAGLWQRYLNSAQFAQLWTPIYPFFFTKIFVRPSLIFLRQEQPKRRPKPPGLASIATAVLWQQYFNCHNRGRIERN